MRVSCDTSDRGYANFVGYGMHQALLNGSVAHEVITADEERGEVIRWARDEWGEFIRDDDELATELVRGRVEIVVPRDAAGAA